MFPEKIEFDGKSYRTKHVNMLVDIKGQQDNEFGNGKAQKKETVSTSFRLGGPDRIVLEPILRDLDRLYEMRFWIPESGKPKSIQWLRGHGLI